MVAKRNLLLLGLLLVNATLRAELLIAAASDLAPVEDALRKAYGAPVRFSFGSSGALLRQIENGAPFDVFLSANEQYVKDGVAGGSLAGPPRAYAIGRLALWSKSGGVRGLEQLRDKQVLHIAIANPAYAPYGAAARQLLEGAGLWDALRPKLVFGENIRQTLQYAESGNADAALVSWSLVKDRGGIMLPGAVVEQFAAVVRQSGNRVEARRFLDWLTGPPGQAVLKAHGWFSPVQ